MAQQRIDATFPDERLNLMFVCAHPDIETSAHTPLMLQTVLGLDAARIAAAFLVAPAAMGQRLVRAKAKIRLARIPFVLPPAAALPGRVAAVHQAIYAAYGCGWEAAVGEASTAVGAGLAEEAVLLARLCAELLPDEPESLGLLALLLHAQARQGAGRDARGAYVPLQQQDTRLWSAPLREEAEATLRAYLSAVHGVTEFEVLDREGGASPMTDLPFEALAGPRVRRIGIPAGMLKPSTGYAVTRILADSEALADALTRGDSPMLRPPARGLYRFLDGIFLALWSRWPARMPGIFAALFTRVPADAVLRFLDERASWRELLSLVSRLPLGPFVGALFVWLGRRLPFGRRR